MSKRKRKPERRSELRDLNCAICGRPMAEILETIVVTGEARYVAMYYHEDGTVSPVCNPCIPEVERRTGVPLGPPPT